MRSPLGVIDMAFKEEIINIIGPILQNHGFSLISSDSFLVEFRSPNLYMRFAHNPRENSYYYFCRHKNFKDQVAAIENYHIEEFLNIKKEFGAMANKENRILSWIDSIRSYFELNPKNFLDGNDELYREIELFWLQKITEYTKSVSGKNNT